MAYLVNLTVRAQRDLERLYIYINATSSDAALKWYRGLKDSILTLSESPNRCAVTPEDGTLRHLLYGSKPNVYRTIYRVVETKQQVDILHVRHAARSAFTVSEVRSPKL